MSDNCHRHTWEIAAATCDECMLGYCDACIVHGDGRGRTHCVPCALAIAGVRRSRRPKVSRKQRKLLAASRQT